MTTSRFALLAVPAAVLLLGIGGYHVYENGLVPVPLASDAPLYTPAAPETGEDQAVLEALLPPGRGLETFLENQSDLTLLAPLPGGAWAGQLADGLQRSRDGRRWRLVLKAGIRLQGGSLLDAGQAERVLAGDIRAAGADVRVVDDRTLDLRFRSRVDDLPARLAAWRVPGTGPFVRRGLELVRFDGFLHGRAGLAGLKVDARSADMEGHAWAEGLVEGRWAWAVFPGGVDPEDMARVRLAPYDQVRLEDGSVWFVSQRLRRFQPDRGPWAGTRLFGVWQGGMNLPRAGSLE